MKYLKNVSLPLAVLGLLAACGSSETKPPKDAGRAGGSAVGGGPVEVTDASQAGAGGEAGDADVGDVDLDVSTTEPVWVLPNVQPVCDGVVAPPAVVRWLDDFEGGANVLDPVLVTGWAVYADVEETVAGGQGPAAYTPLTEWGSHDPSSTQGMHMQAWVSQSPAAGKNSWGANWQYETDPSAAEAGGVRAALDLSAYTGIVIWARLPGPPGKGNMVVAFPTPASDPGSALCGCDASTCVSCYAHYQAPAKITKTCWSPINVPFSSLKVPYGNPAPAGFDKAHVFGVELQFGAWATAIKANWPVDVVIDDAYFY